MRKKNGFIFVLVVFVITLNVTAEAKGYDWEMELAPGVEFYNFSPNPDSKETLFLEKYNSYEGYDGNEHADGFYDFKKIDIKAIDPDDDSVVLDIERASRNYYNQDGEVRYNTTPLELDLSYKIYRSHSLKVIPDSISATTSFHDDAPDKRFHTERGDYRVEIELKPELFGSEDFPLRGKFDYTHSERRGDRFLRYLMDYPDIPSFANKGQRWRGFDRDIDETVDKIELGMVFSLEKYALTSSAKIIYERFQNQSPLTTVRDTPTDPSIFVPSALDKSIDFIPDTDKLTGRFDISWAPMENLFLATGYETSVLKQLDFTPVEEDTDYNNGTILNNNFFVNGSLDITRYLNFSAYFKFRERDNHSDFDAEGFYDEDDIFAPRIDKIKRYNLGTDITLYLPVWASSLKMGWEYYNVDRDLMRGNVSPTTETLLEDRSLYRENTSMHSGFLALRVKPFRPLTAKIKGYLSKADETALTTEPMKRHGLKASADYVVPVLSGGVLTAFCNIDHKENKDNFYRDLLGTANDPRVNHETENDSIAWGVTESLAIIPEISWTTSYIFNRSDFQTSFIRTDILRPDVQGASVDFTDFGNLIYNVDTHTVTTGINYQVIPALTLSSSYTISKTTGDLAEDSLTISDTQNGEIENQIQTLTLACDWSINQHVKLNLNYSYEEYMDDNYDDENLTGHINTFGTYLTVMF